MMVRVDCGFSSLYDNNDERKEREKKIAKKNQRRLVRRERERAEKSAWVIKIKVIEE